MIPDAAITSSQTARIVMTLDDNDQVVAMPVTLGPLKDGLRVIRSGLTGEERIVISGLQRIRPGMAVTADRGEIIAKPIENGLPNEYSPVPESEWILRDDFKSSAHSDETHRDAQGERMVNP